MGDTALTLLGALKDVLGGIYKADGSLDAAMKRARTAITAYESRSQSGVTEDRLAIVARVISEKVAVGVNHAHLIAGAVLEAVDATTPTPPVSEEYLREVAAKALEARRYQKVADCIRSGMRSSNWPEMLVDPGIIIDALEAYSRVSQPPADGRDDVLEEAAKLCELYAEERRKRMDSKDPNWGDPMVQGHKAVTADMLAGNIRDLKSPPNNTDTVLAGAGTLK